jgi:DNA ligase-associated metallophosphoesterase
MTAVPPRSAVLHGAEPWPGALAVSWRGMASQTLWLLPERALWWPDGRTLFVADVHLGKAAAFRAHGLPVPRGTTADDLHRLSALLQRTQAQRLVVLGDWLHARSGHTPGLQQTLRAWRAQHPALLCVLVGGNHDRHAGALPDDLGWTVVEEPWPLGPWVCRHAPPPAVAADGADAHRPVALYGHVHPVCALRGPGRERLRLPCYVVSDRAVGLPAFGSFTGGHAVPPGPRYRRAALVPDRVVWVDSTPQVPWPWTSSADPVA